MLSMQHAEMKCSVVQRYFDVKGYPINILPTSGLCVIKTLAQLYLLCQITAAHYIIQIPAVDLKQIIKFSALSGDGSLVNCITSSVLDLISYPCGRLHLGRYDTLAQYHMTIKLFFTN